MDQSPQAYEFLNRNIRANCSMLINDLIKQNERNWNLEDKYWFDQLFCQYEETAAWKATEDEDWESEPDLTPREPYEFYIVDNWFAARLREHDQLLTDYWGFWVWGRETTGQSIIIDWVFQKIYADYKNQFFSNNIE